MAYIILDDTEFAFGHKGRDGIMKTYGMATLCGAVEKEEQEKECEA